jgi:hypothetical protein
MVQACNKSFLTFARFGLRSNLNGCPAECPFVDLAELWGEGKSKLVRASNCSGASQPLAAKIVGVGQTAIA